MKNEVLFGPAGIPLETPGEGIEEGLRYCRKIGLDAMEVEFVHGVNMGKERAEKARKVAEEEKIWLSCHAPYYINCCAIEKQKIDASVKHIVSTALAASWLKASPIVIHPGHYMSRPPSECRKLVFSTFQRCLDEMESMGIRGVALGAELTGKKTAYGSLEEIIDLSEHFGLKSVVPVVDYAHYHAREKRLESQEDFLEVLLKIENRLGFDASKRFHCHFSGIEFTEKGEKNHLPIASDSPPFAPLAKAWKERGWSGTAICESPLIEKDALTMQSIYKKAQG
ncbi:MAG: TIM barrel protein [Candidatus Anstonellaceae archaeon]